MTFYKKENNEKKVYFSHAMLFNDLFLILGEQAELLCVHSPLLCTMISATDHKEHLVHMPLLTVFCFHPLIMPKLRNFEHNSFFVITYLQSSQLVWSFETYPLHSGTRQVLSPETLTFCIKWSIKSLFLALAECGSPYGRCTDFQWNIKDTFCTFV